MKRGSLPLNGLRAFEAAARLGSFTLAAHELNVTQTAVSHQIRRLEEQLGVKLFLRQNRNLSLTAAASTILPSVSSAFDQLHLATDRLINVNIDRVLTVSTVTSFAVKWLIPRLGTFRDRHPDIDVRISTSMDLVDFAREDIDLAIRYGDGNWPELQVQWLMRQDVYPVCSPELLEGEKGLKSPQDLARFTLLHINPLPDEWRLWATAAGADRLDFTRGLFFDESVSALQAAADGIGVALGTNAFVKEDLASGRLVVPFDVTLPVDAGFYLVSTTEGLQRPKVKAFRDWMIEMTESVSTD